MKNIFLFFMRRVIVILNYWSGARYLAIALLKKMGLFERFRIVYLRFTKPRYLNGLKLYTRPDTEKQFSLHAHQILDELKLDISKKKMDDN